VQALTRMVARLKRAAEEAPVSFAPQNTAAAPDADDISQEALDELLRGIGVDPVTNVVPREVTVRSPSPRRMASPVGAAHPAPAPPAEKEALWRAMQRAAWHPSRAFDFPYEQNEMGYDPEWVGHLAAEEANRSAAALKKYEEELADGKERMANRQRVRRDEEASRKDRALERELRNARERQAQVDEALAEEAIRGTQLTRAVERERARAAIVPARVDVDELLQSETDSALELLRAREESSQEVLSRRVQRAAERRRLRAEMDALEIRCTEVQRREQRQDGLRQEWLVAGLREAKEGYLRQVACSEAMEEGRKMRIAARMC